MGDLGKKCLIGRVSGAVFMWLWREREKKRGEGIFVYLSET